MNGFFTEQVKDKINSTYENKWLSYFRIFFVTLFFTFNMTSAQTGTIIVDDAWIQQNLKEGALVFDQQGATYIFQTDFNAEGTAIFVVEENITIDLNGHTIKFGNSDRNGTIGIYPFKRRSAWDLGSDDKNYSFTEKEFPGGSGTVIKNGKIIWGGVNGTWATAIGGAYSAKYVTIENMYLETGGKDGACVNFNWADIVIHDTYCLNLSTSTFNRHAGPGSIKSEGRIVAFNNIIIGGNSAIVAGSNSEIYNNVLRHSGFATNGYGIWLSAKENVKGYNNLILPSNGRGILASSGISHEFYDNLIVVHEKPNDEFGSQLNPPCIRMRYRADNNKFYNNLCLAIGGGENTSGSGAYLSEDGGKKNYIFNNEFRAILTSPPSIVQYANGITLEHQGTFDNFALDIIENNKFGSNNYLIRLAGYDGGCYQTVFRNNILEWIDGDGTISWFEKALNDQKYNFLYDSNNDYVTKEILDSIKDEVKQEVYNFLSGQPNDRNRHTFYAGYVDYDSYITIIDAKPQQDVSLDVNDIYLETKAGNEIAIEIGHSLYIQAKDANGNNIANKTITVSDNSGLTFTGRTDGSGKARLELIEYVLQKSENEDAVSKVARTAHTASIAGVGSVSLPLNVKNDEADPYVINFTGGVTPDNEPPAKPKNLRISAN